MSVAAVMLVKDEADIIEPVVRHTLLNVDEVIVSDGGSTDGTYEILEAMPVTLQRDEEFGHYQGRKTTAMAMQALALGHQWAIPIDADEVWIAGDGRPVRDFLAGVAPDVKTVRAVLYNHFPTAHDPPPRDLCGLEGIPGSEAIVEAFNLTPTPNPLKRIGWRSRSHQPPQFGKVACRLLPSLVINEGNHSADSDEIGSEIGGLEIRHFSWRTPERYVAKMANGYRVLAATDLPAHIGAHWRMHGYPDVPGYEKRVADHFRQWFFSEDPEADDTLVYDPAPLREDPDES